MPGVQASGKGSTAVGANPAGMRASLLAVSAAMLVAMSPALAQAQDDAGSGGDAGDDFDSALVLQPFGRYDGTLDPSGGDTDDFFAFPVEQGRAFSVLVSVARVASSPIELLDPDGRVVDSGIKVAGRGLAASNAFTGAGTSQGSGGEGAGVRVSVHRALQSGLYRLHLGETTGAAMSYSLCAMNCDPVRAAPIDLIFGGSLKHAETKVLLVPPTHGDLGDPLGPTVLDYIQATLDGVRLWEDSIDAFIDRYPQYGYLDDITVTMEVYDEVNPVDPIGYDVVIGYVAAGPAFRGVATDTGDPFIEEILPGSHYSGRYIALSLFGSAPRAGQVLYDFPEVVDLKNVTAHEFGHTFGLGHTTTWDATLGADLMNSPASFVYGNGSPVGDGGERTSEDCLSSLDLFGMAELYSWLPSGDWYPSSGNRTLPESMPYEWFC